MTKLMSDIDNWFASSPPPDGWTKPETAKIMAACIIAIRPRVCVEIGVFGGRSIIPVALALRESGSGTVVGIDPWNAAASAEGQTGADREWWSRQDMHDSVYARFLKEVSRLGLLEVIQIQRLKSDEFAPPDKIDYLTIDGNHGPQSIRDVERYASRVRVGGLCFVDDIAGWPGGAVERSCNRLVEMGFIKLYDLDSGAMFQRISK